MPAGAGTPVGILPVEKIVLVQQTNFPECTGAQQHAAARNRSNRHKPVELSVVQPVGTPLAQPQSPFSPHPPGAPDPLWIIMVVNLGTGDGGGWVGCHCLDQHGQCLGICHGIVVQQQDEGRLAPGIRGVAQVA